MILLRSLQCLMSLALVICVLALPQGAEAQTDPSHVQYLASMYVEGGEVAGTPVALSRNGQTYYFVPFEENGSMKEHLPGLITDQDGIAVDDAQILRDLFRYPGIVLRFSSSVADFESIRAQKAKLLADYAGLLEESRDKLRPMVAQGLVGGFFVDGGNLLISTAGLVKSTVTQMADAEAADILYNFGKELVSGAAQDAAVQSAISGDTTVTKSVYTAHEKAEAALRECEYARKAWEAMAPGMTVDASQLKQALGSLALTLDYEGQSVNAIGDALTGLNRYPNLMTGYKGVYEKGLAALRQVAQGLLDEASWWRDRDQEIELFLDQWIEMQQSRLGGMPDV